MKNTLLHTVIATILLVSQLGMQANAQDTLDLPQNNGIIKISEIPSLKGKNIYGDLIRDVNGNSTGKFYGGSSLSDTTYLQKQYQTDNPNISVSRDSVLGLIFKSKDGSIMSLTVYEAKLKNNDWYKGDSILLKCHEESYDAENDTHVPGDDSNADSEIVPQSKFDSKIAWFIYGILGGVFISLISRSFADSRRENILDNANTQSNINQTNIPQTSYLSKSDIEQILKGNNAELLEQLEDVGAKFNILKREIEKLHKVKETSELSVVSQNVQEMKKVRNEGTEEFCGYAQLPQIGDSALTITDNPERAAFVINRKGSEYIVDLSEDEQILSQLVQSSVDLKMNGSGIIDFQDGELQNAQKVICIEKGLFKEESEGRIVAIRPVKIKKG